MTNIITSFEQLKSVVVALMLADSSDVAQKMHLPENLPLQSTNIVSAVVSPARSYARNWVW